MTARRRRGFTLVEVLVVMAIISVLAGIVIASVSVARRFGDLKAVGIEIQTLVQGINGYCQQWGDYPPSSLAGLKVKPPNTTNDGIEALVLCLSSRKKGGPFFEFKDDRLTNGDGDALSPKDFGVLRKDLDPIQTVPQLFEFIDLWGNPFVYIHNRDYASKKIQYFDRNGKTFTVVAARSVKLGTYQSATTFQIWSFGANGLNENGDGDDIASWK